VRRYLWDDTVIARELAAEVMQASIECTGAHGFGHWAVCPAGQDALIGFCGLRFLDDSAEVELLYGLAPAHWHRGLATEAARAMLRYGFEEMASRACSRSLTLPNTASVRVMQRLGMQFDQRFTHHGLDSVRYVLSREAFQPGDERYVLNEVGFS
jgi:ribosomal-protein-alanine N-acetyltransferase